MSREELRIYRKQLNLSQLALAHAAGVSRWRLITFEQGHLALTADEVRRLKTALAAQSKAVIGDLARLPIAAEV